MCVRLCVCVHGRVRIVCLRLMNRGFRLGLENERMQIFFEEKSGGAVLAHFCRFLRAFCDFLVMFREVDSKIKQNDATEGENIQIFAKIHQKYAKL